MNNSELKKQNLDWANLGFDYMKTDLRFTATWDNGKWSEGELVASEMMEIHEGAPSLHYAQQCFEGLKAQTAKDGRILLFRPELNAERMAQTAARLMMPIIPAEFFLSAIDQAVKANYAWVPPYGSGASLYIRPLLIGVGKNLGLKPAKKYIFRVFVSPVGPYFKGDGVQTFSLAVTNYDRAAPLGTGNYKAGANYAGGLLSTKSAQDMGATEALYLDSAERKYIDEAGSANVVIAMTNNRFVTPKSNAILPSVTRRSIMTLAKDEMKLTTEERPVDLLKELSEIQEMGACGTAAVLSPIGKVYVDNKWYSFHKEGKEIGPVMQALYNSLTAIQKGEKEDSYGWTREVKMN